MGRRDGRDQLGHHLGRRRAFPTLLRRLRRGARGRPDAAGRGDGRGSHRLTHPDSAGLRTERVHVTLRSRSGKHGWSPRRSPAAPCRAQDRPASTRRCSCSTPPRSSERADGRGAAVRPRSVLLSAAHGLRSTLRRRRPKEPARHWPTAFAGPLAACSWDDGVRLRGMIGGALRPLRPSARSESAVAWSKLQRRVEAGRSCARHGAAGLLRGLQPCLPDRLRSP